MSENLQTSISRSSTLTSLSDNVKFINEKLIQKICIILENVIKLNNTSSSKNKTIFSCEEIPKISLYDYLYRIQKYLKVEDNTLILALIYIDRICKNDKYMINACNIHKILFVAIILAIKYNEDIFFTNHFYAKVGGITSKELKYLELKFASVVQFNFFVEKAFYDKYYKYINNDNILKNIN